MVLSAIAAAAGGKNAGVPVTDQGLIRATITAGSLGHAQSIVANIRNSYQTCQAAYAALGAYQAKLQAYTGVKNIRFSGAWCRKDISDKALTYKNA